MFFLNLGSIVDDAGLFIMRRIDTTIVLSLRVVVTVRRISIVV